MLDPIINVPECIIYQNCTQLTIYKPTNEANNSKTTSGTRSCNTWPHTGRRRTLTALVGDEHPAVHAPVTPVAGDAGQTVALAGYRVARRRAVLLTLAACRAGRAQRKHYEYEVTRNAVSI